MPIRFSPSASSAKSLSPWPSTRACATFPSGTSITGSRAPISAFIGRTASGSTTSPRVQYPQPLWGRQGGHFDNALNKGVQYPQPLWGRQGPIGALYSAVYNQYARHDRSLRTDHQLSSCFGDGSLRLPLCVLHGRRHDLSAE